MVEAVGRGPSSEPVRLGVAGLGLAGAFMIRAARTHPRVSLVAGMDPRQPPRAAFAQAFDAPTYESFEELLADDRVEAVYIASPHRFHASQAIAALRRGKHVLVEKPLALGLAECDEVVDAVDQGGRHLIVGHTHAFDPSVRAMRDLVAAGEIGHPQTLLSFNYTDYVYRPHAAEEFEEGKGGGILFNQVAHQVEIARLVIGSPVARVRGWLRVLDPGRPAQGSCMAILQFACGATASLVYSGYDFFDSDEFHGWVAEGGTAKEDGRHGAMRRSAARRGVEASVHDDLGYGGRALADEQPFLPHFGVSILTGERGELRVSPSGVTLYGREGRREIAVACGEGRPGQGDALDALCQAVRDGRAPLHDARWGRDTVAVLVALAASSAEGREIGVPA